MKTKKLNLAQRLEIAKENLHYWQKIEASELVRGKSGEWERKQIKQFAAYIKNTCDMHGIMFSIILL